MNTVIGDLLKVKRGIICHQVNCKYVMGAGLAAQIRKAYPEHYSDYMSRYAHLGGLCITQINSDLYVIGIYGQDSYGRNGLYQTMQPLKKDCALFPFLPKKRGCPFIFLLALVVDWPVETGRLYRISLTGLLLMLLS